MTVINHTGRKSSGKVAGQAVCKALRKRIDPNSREWNVSARDPQVKIELTGKGLTDEGFDQFSGALLACTTHRDGEHPNGAARLTEILLRGNKLTIDSMTMLREIIALNAGSLVRLDISDNLISITDRSQRNIWRHFLLSFRSCCVLTEINFSGNPLGPSGFDVLERVYVQSELDSVVSKPVEKLERDSSDDVEDAVTKSLRATSMTDKENIAHPKNGITRSQARTSHSGVPVLTPLNPNVPWNSIPEPSALPYNSTRGLRSVPILRFSNCLVDDASAFHLCNLIMAHRHPAELLPYVPRVKDQATLEGISRHNGIVYKPSEELEELGMLLLAMGDKARQLSFEMEMASKTENGFINREQRDVQFKHLFDMDRVKNRLIRDRIIATDGIHGMELWSAALKMMVCARVLLLEDRNKPIRRQQIDTEAWALDKQSEASSEPQAPFIRLQRENERAWEKEFPIPRSPSNDHDERIIKSRGQATTPKKQVVKRSLTLAPKAGPGLLPDRRENGSVGRFGLLLETWRTIIAYAVEDSSALSVEQQRKVIRYAREWDSVKQELKITGGSKHEQLWKILYSMNCLSYEKSTE